MADLHDNDHLFEDVSPESPGTIGRNIVRRLGLASQVAEAIRSPNNNTHKSRILSTEVFEIYCICRMPDNGLQMVCCDKCSTWFHATCVGYDEEHADIKMWYCDQCSSCNLSLPICVMFARFLNFYD